MSCRRFWPSRHWQDYYNAALRDHFHYREAIFANASVVVHALRRNSSQPFAAVHDASSGSGGGGGDGRASGGGLAPQFAQFDIGATTLQDRLKQVQNSCCEEGS